MFVSLEGVSQREVEQTVQARIEPVIDRQRTQWRGNQNPEAAAEMQLAPVDFIDMIPGLTNHKLNTVVGTPREWRPQTQSDIHQNITPRFVLMKSRQGMQTAQSEFFIMGECPVQIAKV